MLEYFLQNSFDGGLSDSIFRGMKGSLAEAVGIDIRSTPGVITVSQALVKESAAIVTDFCKFALIATDGNAYFFGDTGKIYKRTSAGVWSNVYTDTNGAVVGCCEFNGYIYWATALALGRQSVVNAAGEAAWASENEDWQVLNTATYHPMTTMGLYLVIGNDTQLATVDDIDTFTANGTADVTLAALSPQYTITAITSFGIDILIGTKVTDTFSSALVARWDMASPAYISYDDIPEIGVNCFIPTDNFMFVQAGTQGRIYYYDGSTLSKKRKLLGNYANKTMTMYPGSYCSFRGVACFGISNLSSNPVLEGVYTISQYDIDYPLSLMLEYVPSTGNLTNMEIGAMISVGSNLLISWRDKTTGTVVGVDNISWTAKYASAYFKTLVVSGSRRKSKTFKEYAISYKSKPDDTDISLSYYPNYADSDTAITLNDKSDYNKLFKQLSFEAGAAQFKVAFTVDGNDAPEVEDLYIEFNSLDVL